MTTNDDPHVGEPAETLADLSVSELIGALMTIQGERASCYNQFEQGFRAFLSDKEEQRYLQLVQSTTARFATLSSQVKVLESQLKAQDREDLAFGIRGIQQAEKVKLEMTATLHVLRRAREERERGGVAAERDEAVIGGDHAHGGSHNAHACPCCQGPPPPEATAQELDAAISEATQNVETAVSEINGLLEELRYEME